MLTTFGHYISKRYQVCYHRVGTCNPSFAIFRVSMIIAITVLFPDWVSLKVKLTDNRSIEVCENALQSTMIHNYAESYCSVSLLWLVCMTLCMCIHYLLTYVQCRDTFWVESLNHQMLLYVPKRIHFGSQTFKMRMNLAVLHWVSCNYIQLRTFILLLFSEWECSARSHKWRPDVHHWKCRRSSLSMMSGVRTVLQGKRANFLKCINFDLNCSYVPSYSLRDHKKHFGRISML